MASPRILAPFERASPGTTALVSAALIGLIGLADVATGEEISSSVFYALPVGLAAWYAGARWAGVMATGAAGTWWAADLLAGATYTADWIPAWNTGVRLAFFMIIASLLVRLRAALEFQRSLAEVDRLTGLANSRRFLAAVEQEVARATRYRHPVSLAYIDLDGFKGVNDRWGHKVGDDVLASVGQTLRRAVRATDLPARLGGDEFAILFPETGAGAAPEAIEKVRGQLQGAMEAGGWPVGFSVGVVTSEGETSSAEELIRRADDLMYEVKRSGKGRTSFSRPTGTD